MDLKSGYPLWLVSSGLPYIYPKLDSDTKTDVLIIGGGISGALTAHYLTQNNIACIVVDRRTIGLGSTCASTALLQYQIDIPLFQLADKIGKEKALRSYQLSAQSVDELEGTLLENQFPGFERKKTLFYASYLKHAELVKKEYKAQKDAGFKVQFWDEKTIKKRFGFSSPAALYSDHSAQTDPYLLTHALFQYNIPKGLSVYDRTFLNKIQHSKRGVKASTENGQTIRANKLVYATGYEVVKYINKKIVDIRTTYAVASEQLRTENQWYGNSLLWETKDPYLYMRTTTDKRILVGGRDEQFYDPRRRDQLIGRKSRLLKKDFGKLFPHLEWEPEFSWAGVFGSTEDGLPYIGYYPNLPNALFALGFGGNGITFSVIAAKTIADLVKGRKNRDLNLFSFTR
jgi:glycine/D-amino acid oxidase-like deaminating enzyme